MIKIPEYINEYIASKLKEYKTYERALVGIEEEIGKGKIDYAVECWFKLHKSGEPAKSILLNKEEYKVDKEPTFHISLPHFKKPVYLFYDMERKELRSTDRHSFNPNYCIISFNEEQIDELMPEYKEFAVEIGLCSLKKDLERASLYDFKQFRKRIKGYARKSQRA